MSVDQNESEADKCQATYGGLCGFEVEGTPKGIIKNIMAFILATAVATFLYFTF